MGEAKDIQGISDLRPDPANANLGTERGLRMLDDSLREDGAGRSILVDRDGVTIAGAKTLERAADIGLPVRVIQTDGTELVVVQRTDLDLDGEGDEQVRARRMAYRDNRSSEVGLQWDVDQLLADVDARVDLGAVFRQDEIDELLAGVRDEPADDPGVKWDQADEAQEKWQVRRGQVWEVSSVTSAGTHRLMCGDSTSIPDVAKLMGGAKAALGFTSPPYWVGKEYERQQSVEEIDAFVNKACAAYNFAVRKDKSRIVINTSTGFTTSFERKKKRQVLLLIDKWANGFHELGWNLRHVRHWLKEGQLRSTAPISDMIDQHCEFLGTFEADEGAPMTFDDVLAEHDMGLLETFYNAAGTTRGQERTGQKWALRSYWSDIYGAAGGAGHCASFPVELAVRHILLYARQGELVLDLFVGAGTSIVAAEQFKRIGYGMDLEPRYLALALERLVGMGLAPRPLA